MRILFLVDVLGRTRHFKNVVSGLADRGHTVILAPASTTDSDRSRKGLYDHARVELAACPTRRRGRWAPVMEPIRRSRDHLRFFDPRYSHAVKLAERASDSAQLVAFRSYQTEYVKCGHRLGVPVLYLLFSWDNLTNRGSIRAR